MTAMIWADVGSASLVWDRRAAVFEYLLTDLAVLARTELKMKLREASECAGWNVGDLSSEDVVELDGCVVHLMGAYRDRALSARVDEPDYVYLAESLQELHELLERLITLRRA